MVSTSHEPIGRILQHYGVPTQRQQRLQSNVLDVLAGTKAPPTFSQQQALEAIVNVTRSPAREITRARAHEVIVPVWAPVEARDRAFEAVLRTVVKDGLWTINDAAVDSVKELEGAMPQEAMLPVWKALNSNATRWTDAVCARHSLRIADLLLPNIHNALYYYACCVITANIDGMARLERLIGFMQRYPLVGRRADNAASFIVLSLD